MRAQPQPEPFGPGVAAKLDRAEALCAGRGQRLTDLRRQVLGLIIGAGAPIGAYELLDRLRGLRTGAAPPTVYRALDFLLAQGIVHRVERLSAFVSCFGEEAHEHGAQFLICRSCGQVIEIEDHEVEAALARAAARSGFRISGATIEAEGRCAACQAS